MSLSHSWVIRRLWLWARLEEPLWKAGKGEEGALRLGDRSAYQWYQHTQSFVINEQTFPGSVFRTAPEEWVESDETRRAVCW